MTTELSNGETEDGNIWGVDIHPLGTNLGTKLGLWNREMFGITLGYVDGLLYSTHFGIDTV